MEDDEQSKLESSGGKEVRGVSLQAGIRREIRRVVVTRDVYVTCSDVLWDYLDRSLLPRIEGGEYSPRRLAAEVVGEAVGPKVRERVQLETMDWRRVEEAARRATQDLRRREEQVAWEGSLRAVPFCQVGPRAIVRAAAREIAGRVRGAASRRYSHEDVGRWGEISSGTAGRGAGSGPGGSDSASAGPDGEEPDGEGPGGEGPASGGSEGSGSQVLPRLPGRERAGKLIVFQITAEAKEKLSRKADRLNQTATDLARRSVLKITSWIEDRPGEASEYVRAESSLYRAPGERPGKGDYRGFHVRVAPKTKRRLERARRRLEEVRERPGRRAERGPGRHASQREILQAAARLALESDDMRPPLPGDG